MRVRLTTHAIRTVEHNGGLDAFLLGTPDRKLPEEAQVLKRRILRSQAKRAAAADPLGLTGWPGFRHQQQKADEPGGGDRAQHEERRREAELDDQEPGKRRA